MKIIYRLAIIVTLLLVQNIAIAQVKLLNSNIEKIVKDKKAVVGVAACPIGSTEMVSVNGHERLPMLSVFKFHLALAVLDQIDQGKFALNQKIKITKADLLANTWSPIRDKDPNAEAPITIAELIEYTVAQSDNNGCDILLRLIGGVETVENYLDRIGVQNVEIKVNEEQMNSDETTLYQNWTTPQSAVLLLSQFFSGDVVSASSRDFLYNVMANTTTGTMRLKGLLPTGTVVAHKTGSSGVNAHGITAATNDIGIITLPDGTVYAIAVFVSESKENNTTNEAIIAEISQAVWENYKSKSKKTT